MKVCIAQTKSVKGDISANLKNHLRWINVAVAERADLMVFPELSLTGYEPTLAQELASGPDDPRWAELQKISNQHDLTIGVGLPVRSEGGIFIGMIVLQPGGPPAVYSKQLLHEDELPYFIPGDKPMMLTIKDTTVALAICYEALQPPHAEQAHDLGATLYLASVAKAQSGIEKAQRYFPSLATRYALPVLMANGVGFCDNFESRGQSSVWSAQGQLLGQLHDTDEGLITYDTTTEETIQRTASQA